MGCAVRCRVATMRQRLKRACAGVTLLPMADTSSPSQSDKPSSSQFDRLESWKEIAVYFRRDVRTVQRWQDRAGLPVHRHEDPKQRAVFAFRKELDEWRSRARMDNEESLGSVDSMPVSGHRGGRGWLIASGVVVCAAIAVAGWRHGGWRRSAATEPVTTKSQEARQLFDKGEEAAWIYHLNAARVLFEAALRQDPDFALAHSSLASVLDPGNGEDAKLVQEHMQRALALSSQITEIERLKVMAASAETQARLTQATAAREALARIDPDNGKNRELLAFCYLNTGRVREGTIEAERAAALRPDDFRVATYAAQAWALWGGDIDRARPYADRARALWPTVSERAASERRRMNLPPAYARDVAWVLFFPAYERWRAGDVPGTMAEVQRVLDSDPLPSPAERDALLTIGVAFQMSAGRLGAARVLVARMSDERLQHLQSAVIADVVDDFGTLRAEMSRVPVAGEVRALRYVRAGLYLQAEQVVSRGGADASGFLATASGELALRRGQAADAIPLLQRGVAAARHDTLSERYLGAESLAAALERLGRKDEALEALEAAGADFPRYTRTGPSAAFWLRVLDRLARAYREHGRDRDAKAVEDRLRRLLVMADANHPLVR